LPKFGKYFPTGYGAPEAKTADVRYKEWHDELQGDVGISDAIKAIRLKFAATFGLARCVVPTK
jgi:hypothetical protein